MIVCVDFVCSGKFINIDVGSMFVFEIVLVDFGVWKVKGVNVFVVGSVNCEVNG